MAHYNPNGDPRIDYLDVVITKSQPAERVYGAAAGGQAEHEPANIQLEVLRYRPEQDKEPFFQTYIVPCEEDWVVLDALNYVKDDIDRTLSYRWSCHMFVCGSCGFKINGEPKLGCKAFLRDYPDGKIRVEPLDNFPIERDLVVVIDDFIDKLASVKPYLIPKEDKPVAARRVHADAGAAEDLQAVLDVHQLHAVLLGLPAVRRSPRPSSSARRPWRWRTATTRTRAMSAARRARTWWRRTRASGSAASSAPARWSARRMSIRPAPSSR